MSDDIPSNPTLGNCRFCGNRAEIQKGGACGECLAKMRANKDKPKPPEPDAEALEAPAEAPETPQNPGSRGQRPTSVAMVAPRGARMERISVEDEGTYEQTRSERNSLAARLASLDAALSLMEQGFPASAVIGGTKIRRRRRKVTA